MDLSLSETTVRRLIRELGRRFRSFSDCQYFSERMDRATATQDFLNLSCCVSRPLGESSPFHVRS